MNKHILEIKRLAKEFKCMGTYGLIELELNELEKQLESTEVVKEKCNLPVVSGSALLTDLTSAQQEIISNPIRFNGVSIEDIKRIFAEHGIKYQSPF